MLLEGLQAKGNDRYLTFQPGTLLPTGEPEGSEVGPHSSTFVLMTGKEK